MPIHSELRLRLDAEYGPEAPVRRAWVERLISHYHYPSRHIDIEVVARAGRETSVRADIVVYRDRERHKPLIVVETKAPGSTAEVARGADQAESYARLLGAAYFVSTNGRNTLYFRTSLRSRIPVSGHSLSPWTGTASDRRCLASRRHRRLGVRRIVDACRGLDLARRLTRRHHYYQSRAGSDCDPRDGAPYPLSPPQVTTPVSPPR